MKICKKGIKKILLYPLAILIWFFIGLGLPACTDVENPRPLSDFEKTNDALPYFDVKLDSVGSKTIRFDSIAQGGDFSLAFTPLNSGKIKIMEEGKSVFIQMNGKNWKKDSTFYTICKNKHCREGKVVLTNIQFKEADTSKKDTTDPVDPVDPEPIDTTCSERPFRMVRVDFNAPNLIGKLFPNSKTGTVDSVFAQTYRATALSGDSLIRYTSQNVVVDQLWAWDTITYKLKEKNRKCWRGKIAIVLGDTCEPHARDDAFTIPSGSAQWSAIQLANNDRGCNGTLGDYFIGIEGTAFDPGDVTSFSTLNGIVTESAILGVRQFNYQRTNPNASSDQFLYYFKNNANNRVTKAWVKIKF